MSNAYKINAADGLRIPILASDPSAPENGTMWYNSTSNEFKKRENGTTSIVSAGDVIGPASSTDNAITRFDGTDGKAIQNSGIIVDDLDNITGVNDLTVGGNAIVTGDLTINGTTTTVNTADLDVEDNNILVRSGAADATGATGAGLSVERGSTGADGSLIWDETLGRWKMGLVASEVEIVDLSSTQTLTNKTFDADLNTLSNVENADIKVGAAIDATKISDGSVDNTEFGYLNGVTSAIQTQIDGKASTALSNLAAVAINTSLISDTNNTDDLGSAAINWKDVHSKTLQSSTTLDLSANSGAAAMTAVADTLSRGKSASALVEEEYVDATTLLDATTAVVADFTFAAASYNAIEIEYLIREATSLKTRVGKLMVTTDGTSTSITDSFTEVGDPGVTWTAAVNTGNVEISYTATSTTNARTMRADLKRFRAI